MAGAAHLSSGRFGAAGAQIHEAGIASAYGRCHPQDSWADLKRRAAFDKRAKGLMRHWLASAGAPAGGPDGSASAGDRAGSSPQPVAPEHRDAAE